MARPPSAIYQIRKFARRNRAAFVALVSIAAVLILATIVSIRFGVNEAEQRRDAVSDRDTAEFHTYVANIAAADASLMALEVPAARVRLQAAPAAMPPQLMSTSI